MPRSRPVVLEYARQLARAVDAKGGYFPGHSDGVAYLLRLMSSVAEMDSLESDRLELAGMLHDVGKIHIHDAILRKEGGLTDTEFAAITMHPIWGEQIVKAVEDLDDIAKVIRHHHERWDGTGYPDGLKGDEIPFHSRLLLVADAFHVMTSKRSYSEPMSRADAVKEIARNSGSQFCPIASSLLVDRSDSLMKLRLDWQDSADERT